MNRLGSVMAVLLVALSACDWEHFLLINSIPLRREAKPTPLRVYLAADGVSEAAVNEARARGAFADYSQAAFIPIFPATSDASFTRLFRAPPFNGYEYGYYDPEADRLQNSGLEGVVLHVVPPFEGSPIPPAKAQQPPHYYQCFDVHAQDYFDGLWSFDLPRLSYAQALDNMFMVLSGRLASEDVFVGYLLETDVLGHQDGLDTMVELLLALDERLRRFQSSHPERALSVTLFTDHGNDHVKKPPEGLRSLKKMLEETGIESVKSFAEGRAGARPWAVAVEHVRVTYGAIHTEMPAEVAARLSQHEAADLVVAVGEPALGGPNGLSWFELYAGGHRVAHVGYEPLSDQYWVAAGLDQAALDLSLSMKPNDPGTFFGDETLFAATRDRTYPDLFFRARTSLEALGVKYPAQVLVSLKAPNVSSGFTVPVGDSSVGTAGSHGAMDRGASHGMLLSTERELPPYVRSDTFLDLFPSLRQHLIDEGRDVRDGVTGAELDYDAIGR